MPTELLDFGRVNARNDFGRVNAFKCFLVFPLPINSIENSWMDAPIATDTVCSMYLYLIKNNDRKRFVWELGKTVSWLNIWLEVIFALLST